MAVSGDTSRAALQDLAKLLDAASSGLGEADFAVTINVTAAGAVLDAQANYQPQSIQRLTLNTLGELRISQGEPLPSLSGSPWGAHPWGTVNLYGNPWEGLDRG